MCLIQRKKTTTNLRFLFKEVVCLLKVFIKRKVSVIRHISSSITSLKHSQLHHTGNFANMVKYLVFFLTLLSDVLFTA